MNLSIALDRSVDNLQAIRLYRCPLPPRGEGDLRSIARPFGLEDSGILLESFRFILHKANASLEIFSQSDSLWFRRKNGEKGDVFVGEGNLIPAAIRFLEQHGLFDNFIVADSESYSERRTCGANDELAAIERLLTFVNFRYRIGDIPVIGPGAKARVSFGPEGVEEMYRFWRNPVEEGMASVIGVEVALSILLADPVFGDLNADARVVVREGKIAYYSFPVREYQSFLVPVYAFQVEVRTKILRHNFLKAVQALSDPLTSLDPADVLSTISIVI